MASSIWYISVFTAFFILLGIFSPLMNAEFNTDYDNPESDALLGEDDTPSSSTALSVIINLLIFPFWTFGLPTWFNASVLLIIRIIYIVSIVEVVLP